MVSRKTILGFAAFIALVSLALDEGLALVRAETELAAVVSRLSELDATSARLRQQRNASVQRIRTTEREIARLAAIPDAELDAEVAGWLARVATLHEAATQQPEQTIPEFSLLTEKDWFNAARDAKSIDHDGVRGLAGLQTLRTRARMRVAPLLRTALVQFADAHDGRLPDDVLQLAPYALEPVGPVILARYEMIAHGNLVDVPPTDWLIDEKTSFDEAADTHLYFSRAQLGTVDFSEVRPADFRGALQAFRAANNGQFPTTPAQLLPFFSRSPSPVAMKALLERPASDFTPEKLRQLLPAD